MVLFIQTAVSFSNRKESTRLLFLYGVLSGKTACNKFMDRDQGFHSKTQSFFPFFSFFALCLGLFTEQTTSLMLLVVPPQGADGV